MILSDICLKRYFPLLFEASTYCCITNLQRDAYLFSEFNYNE